MTDVDAGERCPKPNDSPPPWSEPLDELPPVVKPDS